MRTVSSELESMNSNYLYWAEMLRIPLMSKDTRAGSRRTEPTRAVRRVFRHKRGAHQPIKNVRLQDDISDAPALYRPARLQVVWNKVTI